MARRLSNKIAALFRRRPVSRGRATHRRRLAHEPLEPRRLLAITPLITEFLAVNDAGLADQDGDRSDWIEIHNPTAQAVSLAGWSLTDDADEPGKWTFPAVTLDPGAYRVVFASGKNRVDPAGQLHTSFKLDGGGEYLALVRPDRTIAQEFVPEFPDQRADVSFGLAMSASGAVIEPLQVGYFVAPTPGSRNGAMLLGFAEEPEVSVEHGFFESPFAVEMTTATDGAAIYYTTDGTVPTTTNGARYQSPVQVTTTTVLRAAAFRDGFQSSSVNTQTYLFLEDVIRQSNGGASDGLFSTLEIPGTTTLGTQFTLAAYVDFSEGKFVRLFSAYQGTGTVLEGRVLVDLDPSGSRLPGGFRFMIGGHGTAQTASVPAVLKQSGYHHVAVTYNNGAVAAYIDGVALALTGTITGGSITSPVNLRFGEDPHDAGGTSAEPYHGRVDEIFVLGRAMSQAEIATIAASGVLGNVTPLPTERAVLYDFEGDYGATITDKLTADGVQNGIVHNSVTVTSAAGNARFGTSGGWFADPAEPELPAYWGSAVADYEMDPNVVNQLPYSQTIIASLKAIPTISLVLDLDDMFGPLGIYSNPLQKGDEWERPVSAEFFDPNSDREFQIDAGVRIHGGSTRRPDITPAHSFRLSFRSEYGASKLEFPLFERTDTSTFDKLVLDAGSSDNWTSANTATGKYAQFIRDQWARDTLIAMGHEEPDGTFVHLYINGLYWGLYNASDRVDEGFAAEHFGGTKDEYDVIVDGAAEAGTITAWNTLLARVRAGNYAGVLELLDVDNFIDYMIVNMFTGNWDWPHHNWCAMRRQAAGEQFKFVAWDVEVGMGLTPTPNILPHSLTVDLTGTSAANGPGEIYSLLSQNAEFRLRFADRLQKHFFNGGVLTPERSIAIYDARAEEIELALVAESARWGDVRREPPDVPDGIWLSERNWIEGTFFPQRPAVVLGQFRARGLFPSINAPSLSVNGTPQYGGQVDSGDLLSLTSAAGTTIYYTLDGSDPRAMSGTSTTTTIVATDVSKTALVPSVANGGAALGTLWTGGSESAFAALGGDAAWASGILGVGYDKDPDFLPYLGINVQSQMAGAGGNNSVYVRVPFTVDAGTLAEIDALTLKMKYDDGFVAYLNGQIVARASFAGTPQWNSYADYGHESQGFESFDITEHAYLLHEGQNILAIHGLNRSTDSSDMIVLPVLEVTTNTGSPSNVYTGPITLDRGVTVKARARSGDTWSALVEARFFVVAPADASNLAITEINYNPHPPTAAELAAYAQRDNDDFEFIELRNTSETAVDLTGLAFTAGITFDFANSATTVLGPGEYFVLARDLVAFATRYGNKVVPAGQYDGNLNNGGERILLVGLQSNVIHDFEYGDSGAWPTRADGGGSSLELLDPAGDYGDADNWHSSAEWGGSPGAAPRPADVLVNEVFSHSGTFLSDWIELVNTTDRPIDLGGWYLSDSGGNLWKFRIPEGMVIPAGGYLVFDEDDFGGTGPDDFALDAARGDEVWLLETDYLGNPIRVADRVEFGAAVAGESFGRWPDAAGDLYPMAYRTLGAANSGPRVGPVLLSEIQYNPGVMAGADDLEFVEIHNPTDQPVDLTGWRIRRGIDFDFATGTTLAAGGTLTVVPFDPFDPACAAKLDAFRARYGITQAIAMAGPYSGKLDNGGERVELQRAGEPPAGQPTVVPWLLVDAVRYDDLAPWPVAADGDGSSLARRATLAWGPEAASWVAASPTPGSFLPGPEVVGRYVFYDGSKFDDPTLGGSDDAAIAPGPSGLADPSLGKTPLLPGRAATVMNYTNYGRGVNGIIVDIARLADGAVPSSRDFEFRVGNDNDPADWPAAPPPLEILFEPGGGLFGSDRVRIIWADGAIRNQWLRVRVLSDFLGLADDDVFYWGNAIGETGDSAEHTLVNATDVLAVRGNLTGPLAPAAITSPYDFNRDQLVNATDLVLVRENMTSPLTALRLITPPRYASSGGSQAAASPAPSVEPSPPAGPVPLVGPVPLDPVAAPRRRLVPAPSRSAPPLAISPVAQEPAPSAPRAGASPGRLAAIGALGQMDQDDSPRQTRLKRASPAGVDLLMAMDA